jgi:autotransporter translocation and assembly factor TamB
MKTWWKKYRKLILCLLAAYVVVMLALIFLTGGPQREPFLYQIF